MRYERIPKAKIYPVQWWEGGEAFNEAVKAYEKHSQFNFWDDLVHYMRTGFVVIRPKLFVMGKPIEHEGRRGWFIQMASGNLLELITCLPCRLDFIAFCRNDDDVMRVVDFDWFVRKAAASCLKSFSELELFKGAKQ